MNICVFCSGRDLDEKYVEPAKELAKLLAQNGHNLVWGGSDDGLMKIMAAGVQEGGGKLYGISVEPLKHRARKGADEMIITKDFAERKAVMLARADAIVVLVGGTGTLDEASEIIENKKHKDHNKPIIILNTAGFYDGLATLLKRMEAENFLPGPLKELVDFAESPSEVIRLLREHEVGF